MNGKVALVTGGSTGIGRATALRFAKAGAKVVIADIQADHAQETIKLIKDKGSEAAFIKTDVADEGEVENMIQLAVETFGGLDYAFNNAGIGGQSAPIHQTDSDMWARVIDINLNGVFYCLKYELAFMVEHGGGAIVNTASIGGLIGMPSNSAYGVSKHGVVSLTKSAALAYAARGIRVNSVNPGWINTPMIGTPTENPESLDAFNAEVPMGRIGQPEEVANAVVWLCSDEASYITGHMLVIDGGASSYLVYHKQRIE